MLRTFHSRLQRAFDDSRGGTKSYLILCHPTTRMSAEFGELSLTRLVWNADSSNMRLSRGPKIDNRASDRVVLPTEIPVYLKTVFNGAEVHLLVEDLSVGGAMLMCPDVCESLQTGQRLRGVVITLPDSHARVDFIVRWQLWPRVGVEFDKLSPETMAKISQFLASLHVLI